MSAVSVDNIDHEILDLLVKNARSPSKAITDTLNKKKIVISDRAVRKRITRLEKSGAIRGYHAQLDFDKVGLPISRVMLIKFKPVQDYRERAGAFVQALMKSKFISHVSYVLGEYNLVCMAHYASRDQATFENVSFQHNFHDIIREYTAYDCQTIKLSMTGHHLTP